MIITNEVKNFAVKKVLVDQESLIDILYWKTYQNLQLSELAMIMYDEAIYGFLGEKVCTKGYIDLYMVFRERK